MAIHISGLYEANNDTLLGGEYFLSELVREFEKQIKYAQASQIGVLSKLQCSTAN
jgi:hypothetical protein